MVELLDVLGRTEDSAKWIIARVETINAGTPGHLDLVLGDAGSPNAVRMHAVPFLDTYAPSVGDVVHVIARTKVGAVVIGSVNSARAQTRPQWSMIDGRAPTAADGSDGDLVFRADTVEFFRNVAGTWTLLGTLTPPAGP